MSTPNPVVWVGIMMRRADGTMTATEFNAPDLDQLLTVGLISKRTYDLLDDPPSHAGGMFTELHLHANGCTQWVVPPQGPQMPAPQAEIEAGPAAEERA